MPKFRVEKAPIAYRYPSQSAREYPNSPVMFGPNIIGQVGNLPWDNSGAGGAGALSMKRGQYKMGSSSGTYTWSTIEFSAELANSLYGRSETMQPASLRALPCIKA